MQLTSLFALLPLLALVSAEAASQGPAAVMETARRSVDAYNDEATYQKDDDNGDYHDEPEAPKYDDEEEEDDEKAYGSKKDRRTESPKYKAVPNKTVVIVVAKSQTTTTRRPALHQGVVGTHGKIAYTTPGGRPVTPVSSPYMLAINRTFALRINTRENSHIKRNRVIPDHTHCLTVRRRGLRNRFKARIERCSDDQRFWIRSPMSFRFEAAGNEKVHLVWMDPKGVKRCAHHDSTGTRFYPCSDKSTKPTRYEILPTDYTGKIKIKEEGRNRCFDGDHNNLWMNRCRGFKDQAWDLVTISYDQF